jgi:hypothetical protein
VRWPPACEDVSPEAEEFPLLSQLRVAVMKSEKMLAEAGGGFGDTKEEERPPLKVTTKQRLVKTEKSLVCCSQCDLWSV